MPVIPLHPPKRQLGTHVLLGRADEPFTFRVVGPNYRVLSVHRSLAAACARARWHAGTRFVYVEFPGRAEGECWDGLLGRLVAWSDAVAAMGETCSYNGHARQGLAAGPSLLAVVVPFRKCLA